MTYWLSRAGATQAEGPFTPRQIQTMWSNGQITAADQLCPTDVPDGWMPADMVVDELEERGRRPESRAHVAYAPPPAPVEKKSGGGVKRVLIAVLLFSGVVLILGVGEMAQRATELPGDKALREAQRWVRMNLADRDAQVVSMSQPLQVSGTCYRLVQVRGKNAFGGPIVAAYVAEGSSADSVHWLTAEQEFVRDSLNDAARLEVARRLGLRGQP